jgi:hypothetical protein
MVGHSCWLLYLPDFHLSRNLMAVGVEVAVLLSHRRWFGISSGVGLLVSQHMTWEVFRGIAEVHHWWHIHQTNWTNTSQATEDLVLDDCKSASPMRNKVSSLIEPFGVNQRQINLTLVGRVSTWASYRAKLVAMLHNLGLERLQEVWVNLLLHLQLLGFRSNWEQASSYLDLKRMSQKRKDL